MSFLVVVRVRFGCRLTIKYQVLLLGYVTPLQNRVAEFEILGNSGFHRYSKGVKRSDSHRRIRNIRRSNIRSILGVLKTASSEVPLATITSKTGLSRPTVSQVLRELETREVVTTVLGVTDSISGGRPPTLYRLRADHHANLFLRLTLGAVHGALFDAAGNTIATQKLTYSSYSEAGAIMRTTAKALVAEKPEQVPLARTVIAMVGIVRDGVVVRSRNFPELEGESLHVLLADIAGDNILIANDAKLAGRAAHKAVSITQPTELMIGLHVSEAIGCAVVIGGTILEGAHGAAGELGSDRKAGWPTAERILANACQVHGVSTREIFARAGKGEQWAQEATREAVTLIGSALIPLVLGLDPDTIVVAGAIIDAEPVVLSALREVFDGVVPYPPQIVVAEQGRSYVTTGALQTIFDNEVRAVANQLLGS